MIDPDDTMDINRENDATDLRPLEPEREPEKADRGLADETPDSYFTPRAGECNRPRGNMAATNWLDKVSDVGDCPFVKVQFKNTRTGFYENTEGLRLKIGDIVAVEANPGHDIGEVMMVGPLVRLQMRHEPQKKDSVYRKVFRIARPSDLEKYEEAKARETDTMIRSRKIAEELGLKMKIGDVEYQGDGAKAIFYYIADDRVDFRKLIRLLADTFKIRVEMKQIGARQEAGRIGGIGPCGRPLCCASWMTRFASVSTSMARMQDLSMNPQKLAGQCAKLKCCLNFEAAAYAESQKLMPHKDIILQTKDADYFLYKTDPLRREITYTTEKGSTANAVTISTRRANEVIALNKQGIKVDSLNPENAEVVDETKEYVDLVGQDSLTRFDKNRKKKRKKKTAEKQPAQQEQQRSAEPKKPKPQKAPDGPTDGRQPQQRQRRPKQNKNNDDKPQGQRPKGRNNKNDKPQREKTD